MPIPKPKDDEKQDEFIERCMSDKTMKEEFKDNKQRLAVCFTTWRKEKESKAYIMKVEKRAYPVELRVAEDEHKIIGHAAIFNKWSEDLGGFKERIQPGAFLSALESSDVRALWNHDPNIVLGRTKSGTLTLEEDSKGLKVEIVPPSWASGYMETIKRGDVSEMSFAFVVAEGGDEWEENKRTIKEFRQILDVCPCTYPAYPQTDLKIRSLLEQIGEQRAIDVLTEILTAEVGDTTEDSKETPTETSEAAGEAQEEALIQLDNLKHLIELEKEV